MYKITVEDTQEGTKQIMECDAYILSTIENVGRENEAIYTSIGDVDDEDAVDVDDLVDAIYERLDEEE